MTFSVIIPCYYCAETLEATVKSVCASGLIDYEILLIDDGSTDGTAELCDSLCAYDPAIRCIHQENAGVSAARNCGIREAQGDYLWFVDADDIPDKDFLANVFACSMDEKVGIIVGNYERLEKNGIVTKVEIAESGCISAEQFPDIFMKYQYRTGFWGYLWNKLIRRKQLARSNVKFQEGLTLAEDLKFMTALYRSNTMLFCTPCIAMRYTVDSDNSSREKKINYLSQLEIQLEIKKWIVDSRGCDRHRGFFKKVVSSYAAFVVFYGYEDNPDCTKLAQELVDDPDVKLQLCTKGIEGTMRPIVFCLKQKWFLAMNAYLLGRKTARNIYRMLKKG